MGKPAEHAADRLVRRINDLLDAERDRPIAYRKTQEGLAQKLQVSPSTLSELLHRSRTRGLLVHLDGIAAYFNVPPSLLIHRNDTSLMEIQPEEYRLLKHWRSFPPDVQMRVMEMFDYFAGLLPEEKEQRRWWMKIRRLTAREREHVEASLDAILRTKKYAPKTGGLQGASEAASGTTPATRRSPGRTVAQG